MRPENREWVAVGSGNECVQLLGFQGRFLQAEDVHYAVELGWVLKKRGKVFSVDLLPAVFACN